jgi:hypothetical protein
MFTYNILIYNHYSYFIQKENYEIYMKNGVVSFRMGVGMFFVQHVNDDHHVYDNVMKETFIITKIRGHVRPYCFGMPPWRVDSVCKQI